MNIFHIEAYQTSFCQQLNIFNIWMWQLSFVGGSKIIFFLSYWEKQLRFNL